MGYDPEIHHRRSIRLKGYDYSQDGGYFVTLCAKDKACLFGRIVDGEMRSNRVGDIVTNCWAWLGEQYDYIQLDRWVLMPNHFHGILRIDGACRGGSRTALTGESRQEIVIPKPLGRLIGAFKTVSTKQVNQLHQQSGRPLWQRSYYEHVIREEEELVEIRKYIANNPANWDKDREKSV